MKFEDYRGQDAVGLARLIAGGEVSATEVLDCCIERIEAVNPTLNAFVYKQYDSARQAIADGLPDGPLKGVPYAFKDLQAAEAGHPMSIGSRLFADYVPDRDVTYVERCKAAGLVIVGRTNTPEFGLNANTEPVLHGSTRNPWNPAHSAGGSSGGAAAAVAAGMLPAAHATDGGGSIRIPAANCGLVGLKPSRGRNPLGPELGEGWGGMSAGHIVCRSVRDSAVFLDCTAGPAAGDPYWAPPPARAYADEVGIDPGKLKIAVMTSDYHGKPFHPECIAAVERTAKLLGELGHDVDAAMPEIDFQAMRSASRVLMTGHVAHIIRSYCDSIGREPSRQDLENMTWTVVQNGDKLTAREMAAATNMIHKAGRIMGEFFQAYDVLLSATLPNPPLPLGYLNMNEDDIAVFAKRGGEEITITPLYNWTGAPALSLPLYWSADGLPVGSHLGADYGREDLLIRLAAQLEEASPWFDRTPEV